ncbi:MAG: capsular biosynthesis protein [Oscillospiraceae bacterium]|nr:capsular biosynthesis protein [Oscillospiraceae bacterium]
MIDLHCHILPGMDDGAEDIHEAKAMLGLSCESGVCSMYLTPHYFPEENNIDFFLAKRKKAWEELDAVLAPRENCRIRLGAEVRYCEQLLALDLRKLTLGESDYLLLELPGGRYPAYLRQVIEALLGKGLIPILAHVERYIYFREEPELLKRLIDLGALAQVSVQALFDRRDKNFSMACMQHGLVQIAASDAHNITDRKPCMELLHKLPEELKRLHEAFSAAVWENELPPYIRATNVKKSALGYR